MKSRLLLPVDGQWGRWGPFSGCSHPCGGGKMPRSRKCDSPAPSNGGRYCVGPEWDSMSCNTHACPAPVHVGGGGHGGKGKQQYNIANVTDSPS